MSGFSDLKQAIDPSVALQPEIRAEETAFQEETLADDVAIRLVLNDTATSIEYFQSKGLMPTGIDNADDLVRAYAKPRQWADGKPRANMPMYTVLEAIEKILPVLHMALFGSGKRRPFKVSPLGKTTPEAARAKGSVLYWASKQAGLKEEMRRTLKTCLTYGFCVGWWGWESKTHRVKVYKKDEAGNVKGTWDEMVINQPTYECLALKNILFDPKCNRQDIQKGAGFVIKQLMITANDLQDMREDDTYKNIPSDDELRLILSLRDEPTEDSTATNKRAVWREFQAQLESEKSSLDPLAQPLEYLEYWTGDRIIGVLQRKIVIRNEENEYGRLPGVSCAFVDVLGSAWGFGIARLGAGEQRLQSGVINNWIDALALVLNPVYQLLKGIGPGTQNISVAPGKVITESGELKPMVTPDVTTPAMTAVSTSEDRFAKRIGANGGTNLPDQALRTGTGVNALTGDVVQRLQYFLEIFIDMIYIPVLESFLETCADKLTPDQINHILSVEEGKAWEGDVLDIYNAQCSVETIAGTNLTAKIAAAQLAPMILQLVSAGPVQQQLESAGDAFQFDTFLKETCELLGWNPSEFFKKMTPEAKAQVAQRNSAQAQAKAQGDLALQNQKHQDTMAEIDQTGMKDAGVKIVTQIAKHSSDAALNEMQNLESGSGAQ